MRNALGETQKEEARLRSLPSVITRQLLTFPEMIALQLQIDFWAFEGWNLRRLTRSSLTRKTLPELCFAQTVQVIHHSRKDSVHYIISGWIKIVEIPRGDSPFHLRIFQAGRPRTKKMAFPHVNL